MFERLEIGSRFDPAERAVVFEGDCRSMLKQIPSESLRIGGDNNAE